MDESFELKELLLSSDKKALKELKKIFNYYFNQTIKETFEILDNLMNSKHDNYDDVMFILDRMDIILKDKKKNKSVIKKYQRLMDNNYSVKYNELLLIYLEKYINSVNKEDKDLIADIVLELKDYEMVQMLILDKELMNTYLKNNINKLFVEVLKKYVLLEEKEQESIDYFTKVIELFIINGYINYDNKIYYYEILNKATKKKHVKRILNIIGSNYKFKLGELTDKYNIIIPNNENIKYKQYSDGRYDYTEQYVITIDDGDSKCLDDAFYLRCNKDGTYTLFVHIIDIVDIIKQNPSFMNITNSENLYLIDDVITMFGNDLANNYGSLLHNQLRNVITYQFNMDSEFNFIGNGIDDYFNISKGIIINKAKLSYNSVDDILIHGCNNKKLMDILNKLGYMSSCFRKQNKQKERYHKEQNIYDNMVGIGTSKESKYIDVYTGANIVQENMILANKSVAEYFSVHDLPIIYRNNNAVTEEKIKDYLTSINIYDNDEKQYNKIIWYLRSILSNSNYSINNQGHYGLNIDYYTHATSPARRYCDIIVENLIDDLIFNNNINIENIDAWGRKIEGLANVLNEKDKQNKEFTIVYNLLSKRKKLIKDK